MSEGIPGWDARDSEIAKAVEQYSSETLAAYREAPRFVEEHANLERAAVEGGYGTAAAFRVGAERGRRARRVSRSRSGGPDRRRALLRQRRPCAHSRRSWGALVFALEQQAGRRDRPFRPRLQVRPRLSRRLPRFSAGPARSDSTPKTRLIASVKLSQRPSARRYSDSRHR